MVMTRNTAMNITGTTETRNPFCVTASVTKSAKAIVPANPTQIPRR